MENEVVVAGVGAESVLIPTGEDCSASLIPQLEKVALEEYEAFLGKVIEVHTISGFIGNDSFDLVLKTPAKVRVDKTSLDCIHRWVDDWMDPVWDVTLVEPHPELSDARSFWVYSTSYSTDGTISPGDMVATGAARGVENA